MTTNTSERNNLANAEENIGTARVEDNNLRAAERLISKWDINTTNKMLFQSGQEEVHEYIDTVQNLHRHMKHLSAGGNSTELIRPQRLMKMSMARLQKEFHNILSSNSEPIDPDGWSSIRSSLYSSTEDSITSTNRSDNNDDIPSARISSRIGWIIFSLACKLEEKSVLYEDVALSHLFLMNNLHYIVQKVKGSNLKFVLGKEWLKVQRNTVRQCAVNYEKTAWKKVLSSITDEGLQRISSASAGEALKEKLKGFNLAIAEVKTRQSGWVMPDDTMRERVAKSIVEKVIPAYNTFLAQFKNRFKNQTMYIKYTPEDVKEFLGNMFQNNPSAVNSIGSR